MKSKSAVETDKMQALAFNDAVRDILRCDGVFKLSDERQADSIWEWDGIEWRRVSIDEPAVDEPPVFEIGDEDGLASRP